MKIFRIKAEKRLDILNESMTIIKTIDDLKKISDI